MLIYCLTRVLLFLAALAGAEDTPAQAQLRKAIRARGKEALLKRYPAATWKMTATVFEPGRKTEYTGEASIEQPTRFEITIRGSGLTRALHLEGGRGWVETNGNREELEPETLAEERERLYASRVATLTPLLDGDFRLALLDEKKVGGHLAVGLRVERDGHGEVRLYFDKQTDLLLSMESTIHDARTEKDVTQEVRYSDYQTVQGIKQPMKIVVRWDGRKHAEGQYSDFKFLEALPKAR